MPASLDLRDTLAHLQQVRDDAIDGDERMRRLELIQRRVMLFLKSLPQRPDWIPVPIDEGDELLAWQRLTIALEDRYPDRIDRADQVSDAQVAVIGSAPLHFSPPERVGAWIDHAVQAVSLLAEILPDAGDHGGGGANEASDDDDEMGTVSEAAIHAGIHKGSITKAVRKGEIASNKKTGQYCKVNLKSAFQYGKGIRARTQTLKNAKQAIQREQETDAEVEAKFEANKAKNS